MGLIDRFPLARGLRNGMTKNDEKITKRGYETMGFQRWLDQDSDHHSLLAGNVAQPSRVQPATRSSQ